MQRNIYQQHEEKALIIFRLFPYEISTHHAQHDSLSLSITSSFFFIYSLRARVYHSRPVRISRWWDWFSDCNLYVIHSRGIQQERIIGEMIIKPRSLVYIHSILSTYRHTPHSHTAHRHDIISISAWCTSSHKHARANWVHINDEHLIVAVKMGSAICSVFSRSVRIVWTHIAHPFPASSFLLVFFFVLLGALQQSNALPNWNIILICATNANTFGWLL